MDNPFSWDSLTAAAGTDEVFNPFGVVFLVLFGVGFLVSLFFYNDGARRYMQHSLKRRILRRGAGIASTVFGIGLFFFGIRALQINPLGLGMRLWLWLSLLAVVLMFAYFYYYLRTAFRSELKAYEERRRKQQYLRPVAAMAGGPGRTVTRAARTDQRRTARRRRK